MQPKVSIIWVNYNSSRITDIVLESLRAIAELDYPNDRYELIVVDNGSTDGSFEKARSFLNSKGSLKKKVTRLNRNLGFTGGCNVGFRARDPESKYVALVNNDAVLMKESLSTLVEYAEQIDNVAGLNGIVLRYGSNLIDAAGGLVDEMLCPFVIGSEEIYPWIIRKPFRISYADGACVLYHVASVLNCMGDKLFPNELFGYYDDTMLGLALWSCGHQLISVPKPVAKHLRGATFMKSGMNPLARYLLVRNRIALSMISNTRYKKHITLQVLRNSLVSALRGSELHVVYMRALYDGVKLGRRLVKEGQKQIDIYKAPLVRLRKDEALKSMFIIRSTPILSIKERVLNTLKTLEMEV